MSSSRTLVRRLFTSRLALKNEDPAFLANALGLLSPKKTKSKSYRPLLFRHFQKGDVTENYNEIRRDLLPNVDLPVFKDHTEQVNNLLMDLQNAAAKPIKNTKLQERNLLKHASLLTSEEELVELACLSLQQNKLSLPLLTRILLNRNLTQLQALPFNADKLDEALFKANGWSQQNFVEYEVLLMKKHHDLNKPLDIIKILKSSFENQFLPLIRLKSLLSFYERVIWKFYFEYAKQLHPERDEAFYIQLLDNIDSTFTMWESSLENNRPVFENALVVHENLSAPQKMFIQLCNSDPVQEVISKQLKNHRSQLLSELKKISISYKVSKTTLVDRCDSAATKTHLHSLFNAIESLIKKEFPDWATCTPLGKIIEDIASQRDQMYDMGFEIDSRLVFA